jgi:hypothetical protein
LNYILNHPDVKTTLQLAVHLQWMVLEEYQSYYVKTALPDFAEFLKIVGWCGARQSYLILLTSSRLADVEHGAAILG